MHEQTSDPEKRNFLKKALAVVIAAVTGLVPAAAGLMVLLDPLRRKSVQRDKILVASLGALPPDGLPQKFRIFAPMQDAWNKYPDAPIGAIYLRRTGEKTVEALNVVCPHAGCFVDFRHAQKDFLCPCHNSTFGLDGRVQDKRSPSPRAMDALEVEIRNGSEIWVRFENFQTGTAGKKAVS
jgi:menaquinol-cytochrome c reductase iron-sulfur subunit